MFGTQKLQAIGLLGLSALTNALIVTLYADRGCSEDRIVEKDLWVQNDSCKTGVHAFESFKITGAGPWTQFLTTFSHDACAGPQTQCAGATISGRCYEAWDSNGASNAFRSMAIEC